MDLKKYGSAGLECGGVVAGALAAGFARKKISFLDTVIGKVLLVIVGILIVAHVKSETFKGIGRGVVVNGALGLASSMGLSGVAGLDGTDGTDGVGAVVQDENGMVYMVNGVGEVMPYEIPTVSGLSGEYDQYTNGAEDFTMSGLDGNADALAAA